MNISKFESIGENCEFGFVQRNLNYEAGGLLRWAFCPPDELAEAIENRFSGLYEFENLTPSADDMVRDARYNLFFHTKMYSENGEFKLDAEQRLEIHRDEKEKSVYLIQKFIETVEANQHIFVFKRNGEIYDEQVRRIHRALSAIRPSRLLWVDDAEDGDVGSVVQLDDGLVKARIDRFAPHHQADDVSQKVWEQILEQAETLLGA